jgi:osmotically-inducible protein OsmY
MKVQSRKESNMKTDEQLKNDVEQELRWEPSIHAEQIGVSVKGGVVELDGHVGSYSEKLAAEKAAFRVANLKAIANEIKVNLGSAPSRTDEDIARAAMSHLKWNLLVPNTVKVKVIDGWVTLEGTVEWQFQRKEAARVVTPLLGVIGVSNEIQLKPKISAKDIKAGIEDALQRDAQIDADSITVETSGSTVTLRGSVESWSEREEAEDTAFNAPGVTRVNNLIEIHY